MNLERQASDALLATSVLLVFVTLLFTLRYPTISADLERDEPVGKSREAAKQSAEIRIRLITQLLPVLIGSVALAYLLAPLAVEIITSSRLELWSFNIVLTALTMIETWTLAIASWSIYLGIRMLAKLRRLRAMARGV